MALDWADTTRTVEFEMAVEFELNENPDKFAGLVEVKSAKGKMVELTDRFSNLDTEEISERNGRTNNSDWDVERRWIVKPRREGVAPLLDPDDEMSTEVGLRSPLSIGVAQAIRRYRMRQFLRGYYGTAYTGEAGTTATPFKAANVLAADTGETVGNFTGLTLAKIKAVHKKIGQVFGDLEGESPIWIIDSEGVEDLLGIDQFINTRYNPQMQTALQTGKVTPFMGFNFLKTEFTSQKAFKDVATLGTNGSGHRRCPVFLPSGMKGRSWLDFSGKMDERSDLNHSLQVAGYSCCAYSRTYEDKCFIVEMN